MVTQDDIIYFVLTDRFRDGEAANNQGVDRQNPQAFHGGDFAGLEEKISYFLTLGVTAVWITPVYLNITDFFGSAGYHGYWAIDFERIDPHLYSADPALAAGSRAYLEQLVTAFHAAGLKVILDMVVNHTGYHTPEYEAWPHKHFDADNFNHGEGTVKGELSGLPDLDHDQPDVADYFVQNILDWIEQTGIDGIRMDTVKHVEDAFWYLFKSQIKTRHPQITLIGEVLDWNPSFIARYQQRHDFDTLFDFPLCGSLKGALIWDAPMTTLARPRISPDEPKGRLDEDKTYTNANRLVTMLDNHDLDRRIFTECLDRTGGDRDKAVRLLQLCLTFLFTTRGIPQIYYGTEIGLEGGRDPDNRRDMPWEVFGADQRPKNTRKQARALFDHLSALARFRRANPAIRCGYLLTLYVDAFVYVYLREFRGNVVLVAINNGRDDMPWPLPVTLAGNGNIPKRIKQNLADGTALTCAFGGGADLTVTGGDVSIQLPGKSAGVYSITA